MRRAFTLIELLVVISIIALLIAILLPALSAARDSAKDIQCLSRLRQVGVAAVTYSVDNKQKYPPNKFTTGYWYDERNIGGYLPNEGTTADLRGDIFVCPNDEQATRNYCMNMWASPVGFNGDGGKLGVTGQLFDADVSKASNMILAGEGWAKWGSPGSYISGAGFGQLGDTPGVRFTGDVGNTAGSRYSYLPTQINWTLHGNNDDHTAAEGTTHFTYADGHSEAKSLNDLVDDSGTSTLDSMWSPMDPELAIP